MGAVWVRAFTGRVRLLLLVACLVLLVPAVARAANVTAGNGIYKVTVDNSNGLYTAQTDTGHPQGPDLNVLYGDGDPSTTFDSVKSYTSGTTYTQDSVGGATSLTPYIQSTDPLGSTGFRTTWVLPGPSSSVHAAAAPTPDKLTIVQDVYVTGTTPSDSFIVVTTSVTNNGSSPVAIGIRYEWDYEIGNDDGPTFQQLDPDGSVLLNEADFPPPGFDSYRIEDNNGNTPTPLFDVVGTANGPADLNPPPTPPSRLAYVGWRAAVATAFDYTPSGNDVASDGGLDDSAALYYWGNDSGNALTIPPGGTASVSAEIGLTPPGGRFPGSPGHVSGTVFNDGNGNGTRQPGEAGMGGVRVFADRNGNGAPDGGEPSTNTAADGTYSLTTPSGATTIREVVPGGFHCTGPNPCLHSLALGSGQTVAGQDFGNQVNPASQACTDLRKFKFKVHHGPRSKAVKVKVFIDGKLKRTVKGKNIRRLTITKLPQTFHKVKVVVYLNNGSRRTSNRSYFQCTKGKPKIKSHHNKKRHRH
jgi:hypothetical protein